MKRRVLIGKKKNEKEMIPRFFSLHKKEKKGKKRYFSIMTRP